MSLSQQDLNALFSVLVNRTWEVGEGERERERRLAAVPVGTELENSQEGYWQTARVQLSRGHKIVMVGLHSWMSIDIFY